MKNLLRSNRGFTLIEGLIALILLAIAAALISGAFNASKTGHAKNCETTILTIQQWERQWQASKDAHAPDVSLCNEMNTMIDKYNNRCGESFGNLSKVDCG